MKEGISIIEMKRTPQQIFDLKTLSREWSEKQGFWSFEEILKSLERPSYVAFFAANEGESPWLGFILVDIGAFSADVMYIYVKPEMRKHGIGMNLLKRVEESLRAMPHLEKLFLEVRLSNQGAIQLYERFGMENVGVRKRYYRDGEDALVMVKKIQG